MAEQVSIKSLFRNHLQPSSPRKLQGNLQFFVTFLSLNVFFYFHVAHQFLNFQYQSYFDGAVNLLKTSAPPKIAPFILGVFVVLVNFLDRKCRFCFVKVLEVVLWDFIR